ncbi:hypothetical protein DOTSEDRAFT_135904 [Dothistroma septosporum NZE10]|uniref:DUF7702 domain-containing protein n=1 Tax=Dothistroma septosporum (strain NZE10 / CBS 128990) TaxID=675120 RepID=N1PHK2_DOTSN|nr:hypothetical protein DOTSEDRAFT_135904 [Dothistroma septosporum NZE10]
MSGQNSDGTHKFELRDGLAITQIVFFSPALLYARKFWNEGRIGWFTIGVFSIIRLVGASTRLASLHNDADALRTTTFVCETLGIILLIFLYLEFTERINKARAVIPNWIFRVPSALTLIDLGLSIGGWVTMADRSGNVLLPTGWTIAGTTLIVFIFAYNLAIFVWFGRQRAYVHFHPEEHRLLLAAALCTAPLVVRNVYPVIFVATSDMFWNQVRGNGYAYLFMAMLPEMAEISVAIWCITGVAPLTKTGRAQDPAGDALAQQPSSSFDWDEPRGVGSREGQRWRSESR